MARFVPVDIDIGAGVNTNFNPEDVAGSALLVCKNADGFALYRGVGKVPGSSRQSDYLGGAVETLHHFEYFQATGLLDRQRLALANGHLRRINADKTSTILRSGMTNEPMHARRMLDRLHLTSPNNAPIKYDGAEVTNWGVRGPGTEETVFESMDDASDWTPGADSVLSDSTATRDGFGAIQWDKTGTTASFNSIIRTGLAHNLSGAGQGIVFVWLYVPQGALDLLAETVAFSMRLITVGSSRYDLSVGELQEGWNLCSFALGSPDAETVSGADLTNVSQINWELTFKDASLTQTGFILAKAYYDSNGAPVATASGAGAVANNVTYRVTFLSKFGVESNAGLPSTLLAAGTAGSTIEVTSIPQSSDPQVVARRLYRDSDSDALWRFVTQLNDNTATEFTDTVSNTARGLQTPPIAGDEQFDNSPPPRMIDSVTYRGHLIGIDAETPFELSISNFQSPEGHPLINKRQFNEELTALERHAAGVIIFHSDGYHRLSGPDLANFRFDDLPSEVGAAGFRAHERVKSVATSWHDDGPYLHDLIDPWYIGSPIKDQIDTLDEEAYGDAHIQHDRGRFRIVYFLQSTLGGAYDTMHSYSYGKQHPGIVSPEGSGVDPLDTRVAAWSSLSLPASINPKCSEVVELARDKPELWIGGADGWVYRLQDPAETDYATGATSSPVDCEIESTWVPLGDGNSWSTPRRLRLSGSTSVESTWTLTVSVASGPDGKVLATKTWDVTLPAGEFDIIATIPRDDTDSPKLKGPWAKVKLANNRAGEDGTFNSPIRLDYIPGRQRGRRAA